MSSRDIPFSALRVLLCTATQISLALGCSGLAASAGIPKIWKPFVREILESNLMVHGRAIASFDALVLVPFREVEIPVSKVDYVESPHFIKSNIQGVFRQGEGAGERITFLVPAPQVDATREGVRYWGVRITGHRSYFVWNSESDSAFVLKLPRGTGRGAWKQARISVAASRYLERTTEEDADSFFELLPECFAARTRNSRLVQTVRSLAPVKAALEAGLSTMPLHSFLGQGRDWADRMKGRLTSIRRKLSVLALQRILFSKHVVAAARAMGIFPNEWVERELAPALGRYLARRHYRGGNYGQDHTQNVGIAVNPSTGKIRFLYSQDLGDIMFDPTARYFAHGIDLSDSSAIAPGRRAMVPQPRDAGSMTSVPWKHAANFAAQTIAFEPYSPHIGEFFFSFVREYLSEVHRITGVRVADDFSEREWERLRKFSEVDVYRSHMAEAILLKRNHYPGFLERGGTPPGLFYLFHSDLSPNRWILDLEKLFKTVYLSVLRGRTQTYLTQNQLLFRMVYDQGGNTQRSLRKFVAEHLDSPLLSLVREDSMNILRRKGEDLLYVFDGTAIAILEPGSEFSLVGFLFIAEKSSCGVLLELEGTR